MFRLDSAKLLASVIHVIRPAIFCAKATSHALESRNPFNGCNVISYERQLLVQRLFMLLQSSLRRIQFHFALR